MRRWGICRRRTADGWALIIREGTTGLTKTPESKPSDNLLIEKREFTLAENGPAKVEEVSETHGVIDEIYRAQFGGPESKQEREELEGYVKAVYAAEKLDSLQHTDGSDLSKPFQLDLVADKAKRGYSGLRGCGGRGADGGAAEPVAAMVFQRAAGDQQEQRDAGGEAAGGGFCFRAVCDGVGLHGEVAAGIPIAGVAGGQDGESGAGGDVDEVLGECRRRGAGGVQVRLGERPVYAGRGDGTAAGDL